MEQPWSKGKNGSHSKKAWTLDLRNHFSLVVSQPLMVGVLMFTLLVMQVYKVFNSHFNFV